MDCADEFLFPEQALMYLSNPSGVSWRVRKAIASAGYHDPLAPVPRVELAEAALDTIRRRGAEMLDGLPQTPKAARLRQSFDL